MKKWLLIFLSIFSFNVYAQNCGGQFDPATGTCRIIGPDGRQILYNSAPPQSARSTPPPPQKIIKYVDVYVPSKYGALALDSKNNVTGGAINADSLEKAKKQAVHQCSNGGKNKHCKVIVWVRNGCIAAAMGKLGKTWTIGKAAEKPGEAESVAMKRCKDSGASECRILVPEACSVPEGMYQ